MGDVFRLNTEDTTIKEIACICGERYFLLPDEAAHCTCGQWVRNDGG